jgi:hypothetical protein
MEREGKGDAADLDDLAREAVVKTCDDASMITALKIMEIDDSAVVILPEDLLTELGWSTGTSLSAEFTPRGMVLSVEEPASEA